MKRLNLFYLAKPRVGGWISFMYHFRACLASEYRVRVFCISKRTETKKRDMGHGVLYQNVCLEDAIRIAGDGPSCIAALGPKMDDEARALIKCGASIVIHDPTELKGDRGALIGQASEIITLRRSNERTVRGMVQARVKFVPMPYAAPKGGPLAPVGERKLHALAWSRLDYDKHTEIIVEANSQLPLQKRCVIYGAENRLYTHHKLNETHPDWRGYYKGKFPFVPDAGRALATQCSYGVDMSIIKGDGGGAQYTFLEAWSAGCVLVIARAWEIAGDEMRHGENCLMVDNATELARVLNSDPGSFDLDVSAGLSLHGPGSVVEHYAA